MRTSWILAVALLATGHATSRGGYTIFTDRTSFNNATDNRTVIDFEGIAPDGGHVNMNGHPLTISGVTFTANPGTALSVIGRGVYYPGNSILSTQGTTSDVNEILATLSAPTNAIGFDIGGSIYTSRVTLTLSSGDQFTIGVGSPDLQFLGVTTTSGISSIRLDQPFPNPQNHLGDQIYLDNFTYSTSAVPEPGSIVGLLAGILGSPLLFRRRRTASIRAACGRTVRRTIPPEKLGSTP